jgi:hypothetical protein
MAAPSAAGITLASFAHLGIHSKRTRRLGLHCSEHSVRRAAVADQAWCAFFMDVSWDYTFLTFDTGSRTIGLLMITDTD